MISFLNVKKSFNHRSINASNPYNTMIKKEILNKEITIYDCLKKAREKETLRNEETWYCGKCKNHVTATK